MYPDLALLVHFFGLSSSRAPVFVYAISSLSLPGSARFSTPSNLLPLLRRAMGLLSLGTPLAWDEAKKYADHVRSHGITQFLHIWDRVKDRCGDELLWGDEVHDPIRSMCLPCRTVLMKSTCRTAYQD